MKNIDVVLSATVSHYNHAAIALNKAQILDKYITGIIINNDRISALFPTYWQKKLVNRRIVDIDPQKVKSLWLPELLQRGLTSLNIISFSNGNLISSYLHDWLASFYFDSPSVLHFMSGLGLFSGNKVRRKGGIVICDARTEHPRYQSEIIRAEYQFLGILDQYSEIPYLSKLFREFAQSDYIIVPSAYAKTTFIDRGFDDSKIFILPYGVDLDQFHTDREKRNSGDKFRVIFVGQLIPRKGVHYLIEAFVKLDLPNSELVIIGSGDGSINKIIEKYRCNSTIKFIPHMPKVELYRYYENSDVLVLPSLSDSFGLVVLEAMACGLPVIVTENVGSKELVVDRQTGFVVPIRNEEALMEKVLFLYNNKQLSNDMSSMVLEKVKEYSWDKYTDRLIHIYETIGI